MMQTDLQELIVFNRAYQETIALTLENLRKQLDENLKRQVEIENLLRKKPHEKEINQKVEHPITKIKDNYFKYRFSNRPPTTKETLFKQKLTFYDEIPTLNSACGEPQFCEKLKKSVITDTSNVLKMQCQNKQQIIEDKLKLLRRKRVPKEVIAAEEDALEVIQEELAAKNNLTEAEILKFVDISKINWHKIANKDLGERWSANSCRLVWINVINPAINKGTWTKNEEDSLLKLVRKYREKNWQKIAEELKTGRSAYLCMEKYHRETALAYCRRDWTNEEMLELLVLSEAYRIGSYVPYNYLCYLNGTRDRTTLYTCFSKIDPNYYRGKWTDEEEESLAEALSFYSKKFNWQEISEMVGTRSPYQCKEHYELKYHNPEKYSNWKMEDDIKLLEAYKKYGGGHWSKIAKELPDRNDHSCLFRFNKLMYWKKQNEWFENEPAEVKEFVEWAYSNTNREIGYTKYGELVPRTPKFMLSSSFMNGVIVKIHENLNLVTEFLEIKKLTGKVDYALLLKIGIYTPVTTPLIQEHRKSLPPQKKRGRKSKSAQKNSEASKEINENGHIPLIEIPLNQSGSNTVEGEKNNQKGKKTKSKARKTKQNKSDADQSNKNKKAIDANSGDLVQTKLTDMISKTPKSNFIENIVNGADYKQSSLVVRSEDIPENAKIPCLVEDSSGFQFVYSLKKDSKDLKKFVIINCRGKLIGIKALNHYVTDEYLTDARLDNIENRVKKILTVNR